jgi:hypothetical protein
MRCRVAGLVSTFATVETEYITHFLCFVDEQGLLEALRRLQSTFARRTPAQGVSTEAMRFVLSILREKEPVGGAEGQLRQRLRRQALILLGMEPARLASDPSSYAELPKVMIQVLNSDTPENSELALRLISSPAYAA